MTVAPAYSEHDLLDAARDGDDRAFEELYARYQERINAFIRGRVRDHGRAEDIVQEVFISALRRLRASEQTIAFKPWIYEIAKNACIDEFRRRQRAREVSLDADTELVGGQRALLSIAPTPPAAMESKQRLDDLRGAFGGLSDNHHQLLVLRELEGLSYDEIGARTGMSRQMVESALFRARRKLTEEYDELASGRRCQQVQSAIADGRAMSRQSVGIRERRQLSRHLAHCQPCRVTARLAGVDESLVRRRGIAAKIAGLLPFPLWHWGTGGNGGAGSHQMTLQSLQNASTVAESGGAAASFGGAAIAAAAIALAGAGGGLVIGHAAAGPVHHAPAQVTSVSSRAAGGSSPASAGTVASAAQVRALQRQASARLRPATGAPRHRHHHAKLTAFGAHPAGGVPGAGVPGHRTAPGTPSPVGRSPVAAVPSVPAAAGGASNLTLPSTQSTLSTIHKVLSSTTNQLLSSRPPGVGGLLGPLAGGLSKLGSSLDQTVRGPGVAPHAAVAPSSSTTTGAVGGGRSG